MPFFGAKERLSRMVRPNQAKEVFHENETSKQPEPLYGSFLGINNETYEGLQNLAKTFDAYNKSEEHHPKFDAVNIKAFLHSIVKEAGTLFQHYKLTSDQMEGMYNIGYQSFQQGNFKKAIRTFRILFLLNPLETKYLFSLGLSLERNKQYFEAATAYLTHVCLDEQNPIPTFRTAICFLEIGEDVAARVILRKVIKQCGDKVQFQVIRERAELFLAGLGKKELTKPQELAQKS